MDENENFNSTMVRLEVIQFSSMITQICYFNSTMVRLEAIWRSPVGR